MNLGAAIGSGTAVGLAQAPLIEREWPFDLAPGRAWSAYRRRVASEQARQPGAERDNENPGAQTSHGVTSAQQLHIIIFDHRIGEELVGCLLKRGLRLLAVGRVDLDVEHLALAHAGHAGDAERLERALDRLALRIEDAGLEGHGNTGLHAVPLHGRRHRSPARAGGAGIVPITPGNRREYYAPSALMHRGR